MADDSQHKSDEIFQAEILKIADNVMKRIADPTMIEDASPRELVSMLKGLVEAATKLKPRAKKEEVDHNVNFQGIFGRIARIEAEQANRKSIESAQAYEQSDIPRKLPDDLPEEESNLASILASSEKIDV